MILKLLVDLTRVVEAKTTITIQLQQLILQSQLWRFCVFLIRAILWRSQISSNFSPSVSFWMTNKTCRKVQCHCYFLMILSFVCVCVCGQNHVCKLWSRSWFHMSCLSDLSGISCKPTYAQILIASSVGLMVAAAMHYRLKKIRDNRIIPKMRIPESGQVVKLEKFSYYVGNWWMWRQVFNLFHGIICRIPFVYPELIDTSLYISTCMHAFCS